jgi:hypothetical protein
MSATARSAQLLKQLPLYMGLYMCVCVMLCNSNRPNDSGRQYASRKASKSSRQVRLNRQMHLGNLLSASNHHESCVALRLWPERVCESVCA